MDSEVVESHPKGTIVGRVSESKEVVATGSGLTKKELMIH